MEQLAKCKSLTATFKSDNLMLDGPHVVEFDTGENNSFHIKIEQCGIRKIILTSDENVSVYDLHAVFSRVERLLMIFDGVFIPLSSIELSESDTVEKDTLGLCNENFMN